MYHALVPRGTSVATLCHAHGRCSYASACRAVVARRDIPAAEQRQAGCILNVPASLELNADVAAHHLRNIFRSAGLDERSPADQFTYGEKQILAYYIAWERRKGAQPSDVHRCSSLVGACSVPSTGFPCIGGHRQAQNRSLYAAALVQHGEHVCAVSIVAIARPIAAGHAAPFVAAQRRAVASAEQE